MRSERFGNPTSKGVNIFRGNTIGPIVATLGNSDERFYRGSDAQIAPTVIAAGIRSCEGLEMTSDGAPVIQQKRPSNNDVTPVDTGTAHSDQQAARLGAAVAVMQANRRSAAPASAPTSGVRYPRRWFAPLRAWMVVLPVDLAALVGPILMNPLYLRALGVMAVLTVGLLANGGFYRPRLHLSFLDDLPSLTGRFLVAAGLVACVVALRHDRTSVDGFMRDAAATAVCLLIGRACTTWALRQGRRRNLAVHRAILVGAGTLGAEVATVLGRYPAYGLRLIGYVDTFDRPEARQAGLERLGALDDIVRLMTTHDAEVLLISDPDTTDGRLADLLRTALTLTYDVFVVPKMPQLQTQMTSADHIGAIPIMRIRAPRVGGWRWTLKRTVDIVVSLLGLMVLSPVLAVCACAVAVESRGGVLFRQQRVGRNQRLFNVLKFRTMRPSDETESRTRWSIADDPRVGVVGKILRRTSLDELPQLWNILRGDMTIVGPRPERPHFVERFSAEHQLYAWRHRVPAGLTGLAQVSGLRGDTPISDRARFDNYYIENWSLWLDLKIVLRTLREVFAAAGR
ncbi:sugar transferase [Dactylosporangium siamense]|uniref:UDP-phosphate galactose phosphotransferase n=1 Tax=Dactylosporangium siamense TaxID=685454 RepID=A0A919PU49_9ACTN|nr:sugar transferase [Dactylosporangium siamense]GIG50257.1 UDP-phosphate galactose phosphotransferase [Dactylosporangium siamense]